MYGRVKNPKEYGRWTRAIKTWAKKIRHYCCNAGLCNLDKCGCNCHKKECCNRPDCKCK